MTGDGQEMENKNLSDGKETNDKNQAVPSLIIKGSLDNIKDE